MATCANFGEQLLDFLYDLLDEEESVQLRLHLESCPACQAELRIAEGHQRLISKAARSCPNVAPFAAPPEETAVPEPAVLPMPAPRPEPAPAPSRRTTRFPGWLRYGSVALAASLLLGVVVARESYLSGLNQRKQEIAQLRQEVQDVDAVHQQAVAHFDKQKSDILKPGAQVQVNLTGPQKFAPAAGANYVVAANSLAGEPVDAKLNVELRDAASKKVLWTSDVVTKGEYTKLAIPPGLEAKEMVLAVAPLTNPPSPPLVAELQAAQPTYATHLGLNKTSFFARETMYFRSLTVDQFSLKPIAREVPLLFSLLSADGRTALFKGQGKIGPGGIGGGQITLGDLAPGSYWLEVASGDPAVKLQGGKGIQRRRFEILSSDVPQLQVVMDKQTYLPGETAEGKLYGPNAEPIPEQRIVPDLEMDAADSAQNASRQQMPRTYSNNEGKFKVLLPQKTNASRVTVNIGVPTRTSFDNVKATINIVPSEIAVDFFPEGGDLIDGVPTRVYYQVRSLQGEPIIPDGRVIFQTQAGKVIYEAQPGKSTGVFALTPSRNEMYRVRLSSSRSEVKGGDQPFANRTILDKGLGLSVPQGVVPRNEPFQARLLNKGRDRRLLVLVTCRGQIVEQQALSVADGESTNLVLNPLGDVAGILRVTAYEIKDQALQPLAERLVFRMPAGRLELAGSGVIRAGQNQLRLLDENRQPPLNCYAWAMVTEAQFAGENEQDLGTHFFLTNDVASPGDLENATLLVRDNAESKSALDLFLGTHGWRRFVTEQELFLARGQLQPGDAVAKDKRADVRGGGGQNGAMAVVAESAPALVSMQNIRLTDLQAGDTKRMNERLAGLHLEFAAQTAGLKDTRTRLVDRFNELSLALAAYQRLPQDVLILALVVLMALTIVAGLTLLLIGFVRLARQHHAAPLFAVSAASFGVCFVALMTALQLSPEVGQDVARLNAADWQVAAAADVQPDWPHARLGERLLVRQQPFALQTEQSEQEALLRRRAQAAEFAAKADNRDGMRDEAKGGRFVAAAGPANQGMGGMGYRSTAQITDLVNKQERSDAKAVFPAAPQAVAEKTLEKAPMTKARLALLEPREYSYAFSSKKSQDRGEPMFMAPATILWAPAIPVGPNGDFQLNFDLPEWHLSSYRIVVQALSGDGKLGYIEKYVDGPTR